MERWQIIAIKPDNEQLQEYVDFWVEWFKKVIAKKGLILLAKPHPNPNPDSLMEGICFGPLSDDLDRQGQPDSLEQAAICCRALNNQQDDKSWAEYLESLRE